jgi:ABC-type polysaccharide/polyol phosphate transport system ATPase subunit
MKNDIAIKLTNISKRYYLHPDKPTLVESLNPFKKPQEFWALKDINLTIKKGERIGIIGPNGAGKTTLLKIISGITKPTRGTVKIHGRIISLIEPTSGFHPEMSGFDNIFLNGTILGMSNEEIKYKLQQIIDFADIGKFINEPVFTYSFGMMLRLGMAIAVHSEPDILIVDESLSMGDSNFMTKMLHWIKSTVPKKITIINVSHSFDQIFQQFPNSILINTGTITLMGNTSKVVKHYFDTVDNESTLR